MREPFPLPDCLILRLRTQPTREDKRAESLLRQLVVDWGKDPDAVLAVIPFADWPATDDPPDFRFPQLIAQGVYWRGLEAIERYVTAMEPTSQPERRRAMG